MKIKTCGQCEFWKIRDDDSVGFCYRYPPTVVYDYKMKSTLSVYPQVDEYELYCGEFVRRKG